MTVSLCSLWPTLVNTALGVAPVHRDYLNVARVLKLSWWRERGRVEGRKGHLITEEELRSVGKFPELPPHGATPAMTQPTTFPGLVDYVAERFGDRVFLPRRHGHRCASSGTARAPDHRPG